MNGTCQPYCNTPCSELEYCVEPNKCVCIFGYNLKGGECIPQCSSCKSEACIAPDVCKCKEGYRFSNSTFDEQECIPECDKECTNGKCAGPNKCECNSDYVHSNGTCIPYCDNCKNGYCISPSVCKCDSGYAVDLNFSCSPVCSSCNHGVCVAPDNCSCLPGYVTNGNSCVRNEDDEEKDETITIASTDVTDADVIDNEISKFTVQIIQDVIISTEKSNNSKYAKDIDSSGYDLFTIFMFYLF